MKKRFVLMSSFVMGASLLATEGSFNPNFQPGRINSEKLAQGRSLKDILAQHGKALEPGKFVLTSDGVLTDELPTSQQVIKLQHRIAKLEVARNERLINEVLIKLGSNDLASARVLVNYIQTDFGKERDPLFACIAAIVQEQHEINLIRTDALRLVGDPACRAAVSGVMRQLEECQKTLLLLQEAFNGIWQILVDAVVAG